MVGIKLFSTCFKSLHFLTDLLGKIFTGCTSTSLAFNISEINLDNNCLLLNFDVQSSMSAQHFKMAVTDSVEHSNTSYRALEVLRTG